jgi:hypothetical protein
MELELISTALGKEIKFKIDKIIKQEFIETFINKIC